MALFLALDFLLPACGPIYVTGFSFFEGRGHYFHDALVTAANHDPSREQFLFRERLAPHVASGRVRLDERLAAQLKITNPANRIASVPLERVLRAAPP